jgi:ADP-heptose:LPS heptosyltransferase
MISKKSKLKNFLIKSLFSFISFFLKKKNKFNENNPKILIVSTTAIGDTLWATPFIKSIKKKYQNSSLSALTSPIGFEILKNSPFLDEIFVIKEPVYKYFFSTLKKIRKKNFEAILIFHASQRLIFPMMSFSKASKIIGSIGQSKGLDFMLTNKTNSCNIQEVLRRDEITKAINVKTTTYSLDYYLNNEEINYSINFLKKNKLNEKKIILVHPGASKKEKCYPKEYFVDLLHLINENIDANIIISGSKKEKELVNDISSKIKGSFSYISESLNHFASIIKYIDLIITNDTGPMHIASSFNKNIISFFGPTNPKISAPFNYKKIVIFKSLDSCKICALKNREKNICFHNIKPKTVFDELQKLF